MRGPERPLRLALLQGDTRWHDPASNRAHYGDLLDAAPPSDLVLLPETWATGFTNEVASLAEPMDGPSVTWMRERARERGAVVAGSLLIREGGQVHNRLIWVDPQGVCGTYDKRHLFRMAREHERFSPGGDRKVMEVAGWRVCPLICYDLRFPVWSRNRMTPEGLDYDLLVYVANWPEARRMPWRTLLRARAIENHAYGVGLNRVGIDGAGYPYAGDSAIVDFQGATLLELDGRAQVGALVLEPEPLARHRERFPAWMDGDAFSLD